MRVHVDRAHLALRDGQAPRVERDRRERAAARGDRARDPAASRCPRPRIRRSAVRAGVPFERVLRERIVTTMALLSTVKVCKIICVFTLRATRRLLTAMNAAPSDEPPPPSTLLGDWYANATNDSLVICVSERTLLPVVLPREALSAIVLELPRALAMVLEELGVDRAAIERERFAMVQSAVSTTANRRVVGFLNEFAFMLEAMRERPPRRSLLQTSLHLAHTPCNASSAKLVSWPDAATRAAFDAASLQK